MIANKILLLLVGFIGLILLPVQMITTFVLGLVISIPLVGFLLLLPLSLIWVVLFFVPLLGLSYVYERVAITRPFISIIGIPLAIIADEYVALIPSMGEKESRYVKMIYCQTFPYSWRFDQFYKNKLKIGQDDILNKILQEVSKAKPLGEYLNYLGLQRHNLKDF